MKIIALERFKLLRQPMIWGLTGCMMLLLSLIFQRLCVDYLTLVQQAITHQKSYQNVSLEIIKPLCSWTVVLMAFFLPVFTTQAFSQEFRQKTFYLWAMSDFSPSQIVLGKFISVLSFALLIVVFLCCMLNILQVDTTLDQGLLFGALLAVLMIGSAFISFGLFISCVIPNPLLAIGISLLGNGFWMMLEWLNPFAGKIQFLASHFSLVGHSYHLLNGIFYSPDLIFYFSFCACWLMLSVVIIKHKMRHLRG